MFYDAPIITTISAALLVMIHCIRLYFWHQKGIWQRPLLWVLFSSYILIVSGFVFKILEAMQLTPMPVSTHAFALGGISLMTMGMMVRVSLGHTGRNVRQPPINPIWMFGLALTCALVRVVGPVALPSFYIQVITLSQILWILAFAIFVIQIVPMLFRPRVDGLEG